MLAKLKRCQSLQAQIESRMKRLLVLGAGGHGKVVAEAALRSGVAEEVGFLDDVKFKGLAERCLGWPIHGLWKDIESQYLRKEYSLAITAIGDGRLRHEWNTRLRVLGYKVVVVVHPDAYVSSSAKIGMGSVIFAQAAIQSEAKIGMSCIVNTGATIDHETVVGDGAHVCPGAHIAGQVVIGNFSWIGIGSTIIQSLEIGSDVVVGAGSVVVRDLVDKVKAYGVPARVIG